MIVNNKNNLLVMLIFWKFFSLIYAFFIFANFTTLGDFGTYINPNTERMIEKYQFYNIFTNRQLFVKFFFMLPSFINISAYIWVFFFTISYLLVFFIIFNQIYLHINKLFFWLLMFSPSFLVWTAVVSKEILFILLYFILLNLFLIFLFKNKLYLISIILLLAFLFWVRLPYTIAYFCLFLGIIFYKYYLSPKALFKINYTLCFILFAIIIIILTYQFVTKFDFIIIKIESYMHTVKKLFIHSRSFSQNIRYDIEFTNIRDLFNNMLWGVPTAFLVPTPQEISKSPLKIIFFIDGLISIFIFFLIINKILSKNIKHINQFIIFIFLPCVIMILFLHYPFGIFNSGTSLRWKQSLVPLVLFFPLMLIGYANKYDKK